MYPAEARSAHDFMSGNASWKDWMLVFLFTLSFFTFARLMATKPRTPWTPKDTIHLAWALSNYIELKPSSSYRNLLAWVGPMQSAPMTLHGV